MTEGTRPSRPFAEALLDVEAAVLDEAGTIVAVNDSWNAFTLYNGGDPTACGVGANYLLACDRASGDANAMAAAGLIRAAVAGRSMGGTSIVIDCHAPAEQRWYELLVSPRGDRTRPGATVMLLPKAAGPARPAPTSQAARFLDVDAFHQVLTRLAALERLIQTMGATPANPRIDEVLRQVDAAIVSLQRTADEIEAQRPGSSMHAEHAGREG